jgi:hypothetical protein
LAPVDERPARPQSTPAPGLDTHNQLVSLYLNFNRLERGRAARRESGGGPMAIGFSPRLPFYPEFAAAAGAARDLKPSGIPIGPGQNGAIDGPAEIPKNTRQTQTKYPIHPMGTSRDSFHNRRL